jgi:hypothetical protein
MYLKGYAMKTDAAEYIGYFSASMNGKDPIAIKHDMRVHNVFVQKSNDNPSDDWWFFLLPKGSTKVRQDHKGDTPRYTVRLPDGYSFTLEMGPLTRDGYFSKAPLIFFDTPA